jgi:hypothetical protein
VTVDFNPLISITADAEAQPSRTLPARELVSLYRTGKHRQLVAKIRKEFSRVINETGDLKAAKAAVKADKNKLDGVMTSGFFKLRGAKNLDIYSQLLCGDVDGLTAENVGVVYDQIVSDPHCLTASVSPTNSGVKFLSPTTGNAEQHKQSIAAMVKYFRDTYQIELDPSCKNLERLCFAPDNASDWNPDAVPFEPLPIESKAERVKILAAPSIHPSTRTQIAERILGAIEWTNEVAGFCKCPGEHLHTTPNSVKDCMVMLDSVPTIKCFHGSCAGIVGGVNHELRSQIAKAEFAPTRTPQAAQPENGSATAPSSDSFADAEAANDPLPGNDDPPEIDAPPVAESARILEMLSGRRFDYNKPPPHTEPRFFIGDIPVCTAGNLTTISAFIKSGKTATFCAAMASAMTTDSSADNLGWRSSNPNGLAILHFDTEQSPEDHYAVAKRAVDRAGLKDAPAWFVSYCLTGCTLRESRLAIEIALVDAAKAHGGIHSIFLDGSADFIANVNDPDESNDFVAAIRKLSIDYRCPLLAAIHLNPNSDKERGHLGSELTRKAESNLKLERDGDVITLYATRNRKAPISKDRGPRFEWSNEHNRHVSIENTGDARDAAKRVNMRAEAEAVFEYAAKTQMSWTDCLEVTMKALKLSQGGARKHFTEWCRLGIVVQNIIKKYELSS